MPSPEHPLLDETENFEFCPLRIKSVKAADKLKVSVDDTESALPPPPQETKNTILNIVTNNFFTISMLMLNYMNNMGK